MKLLPVMMLVLLLWCRLVLLAAPAAEPVTERFEIVTDIYVGVQTECLSREERAGFGAALRRNQGLRIKKVVPGSPAELAGLAAGDLILKNCGAAVDTPEDLLLSMRNSRPGDRNHFLILRNGQQRTIAVRVAALPKPVVVAHVTLKKRDWGITEKIKGYQLSIARLLQEEKPDWHSLQEMILRINGEFPNKARHGQLRLYYRISQGYMTVTGYVDSITVTMQRGNEVSVLRLCRPGDSLPAEYRAHFAEFAGQ